MDENELLRAIQRFPNKQCASDSLPSWLLKKISKMISLLVKSVVNQSFPERIVPKFWKSAQITPLLKKPSLDHNVASFYRPTSNLLFLSKLSERLVLNRVMSYLNNLNLLPLTNQLTVVIIPLKRLSQKCIQTFLVQPMMVGSPFSYGRFFSCL